MDDLEYFTFVRELLRTSGPLDRAFLTAVAMIGIAGRALKEDRSASAKNYREWIASDVGGTLFLHLLGEPGAPGKRDV